MVCDSVLESNRSSGWKPFGVANKPTGPVLVIEIIETPRPSWILVCSPCSFFYAAPSVAKTSLCVARARVQVAAIAFMAIWMYYAAYTASLGEITTKTVESSGGYDVSYKVSPGPATPRSTASSNLWGLRRSCAYALQYPPPNVLVTRTTPSLRSILLCSYPCPQVYDFDQQVQYRGWFLLFCLFWTLNFITAMGQVKKL